MASGVFLGRLRQLTRLSEQDLEAVGATLQVHGIIAGERALFVQGDTPRRLHIVLDGVAARVKLLRNGGRHLATLLIAGDVCDIDGLHVRVYDYGVVALTRCTLIAADRTEVLALCDARPAVARALTWLGFRDNSLLNEAAVSLARRSAVEGLAHLLCELQCRLAAVGLASADPFDLPLSQAQLADALGLTAVHLNRTLRDLRRDGLVAFAGGQVRIPDLTALRRLAEFSPGYLHEEGIRTQVRA